MADTHPIVMAVSDRGYSLRVWWPAGAIFVRVFGSSMTQFQVFRRPRSYGQAQADFLATLPPDITEAAIQESMHSNRYLGRIVARPSCQ